ncbi:MAG: hypothetical protein C4551_00200, partial [Bacillota bacterium]
MGAVIDHLRGYLGRQVEEGPDHAGESGLVGRIAPLQVLEEVENVVAGERRVDAIEGLEEEKEFGGKKRRR